MKHRGRGQIAELFPMSIVEAGGVERKRGRCRVKLVAVPAGETGPAGHWYFGSSRVAVRSTSP
ncbi:MAG: hypothetical protein CMJ59_19135 [Planctomycetaceae bacterium]|nr:hypothetical protein [Planctomycetaceae bacterium]